MDCKSYRPLQRIRDPRRLAASIKILRRRRILAGARWILWTLFIALQIADVVTTNYALAVPGNWEANPIMHLSQTHLGSAWWLPKVAAVGFAAIAVPQMLQPWPIVFAVSYYVMIVSVNIVCL